MVQREFSFSLEDCFASGLDWVLDLFILRWRNTGLAPISMVLFAVPSKEQSLSLNGSDSDQ